MDHAYSYRQSTFVAETNAIAKAKAIQAVPRLGACLKHGDYQNPTQAEQFLQCVIKTMNLKMT